MKHQALSSDPGLQTKLYGLDHLRALAILLVFLFHYQSPVFGHPEWLPAIIHFGWTGVDLFFVLSGFLISSQLFSGIRQGKPVSLREFFLKRFFRILPAFWFITAIYFCFPSFHEREALPALWRFLTFTQNFGLNIANTGTFSHAWSLCVEEHFYILLPLILLGLRCCGLFKKAYWLFIILFLAGFAARLYSWYHFYIPASDSENPWVYWYQYIYYPSYNRLDGLLIGVLIAALYQFRPILWSRISRYGNIILFFGLLILSGAYFLCYDSSSFPASIFGFPLVAIGYGFLVAGAICPSSFLYQWKSKASTLIATLSYALYLSHKGMIHLAQQFFANLGVEPDSNLMLLSCIVSCIAAAGLLHILIEKPFMKIRVRLLNRK